MFVATDFTPFIDLTISSTSTDKLSFSLGDKLPRALIWTFIWDASVSTEYTDPALKLAYKTIRVKTIIIEDPITLNGLLRHFSSKFV